MPHDNELRGFLARVGGLTEGQLLAIIAAGGCGDQSGKRLAMRTAERVAKAAGLARGLDQVRDDIVAWATDRGPGSGQVSGFAMPETIEGDLRRRAAPELIGAAFAIALGDRLRPEASDPLLFAWRSVVETGATADPYR